MMTKRFNRQFLTLMLLAVLLSAFTSVSVAQQANDLDRGRALRIEGKCVEAIDAFQKHLQTNKSEWSAYHNIGLCYGDLRKFQQSIPFFQKAIEINSNDAAAYFMLAVSYNKTNNLQEAISILEKLVTLNPNQDDAFYYLGVNYFQNGQVEKAITAYRKAVQLKPADEDLKKDLAQAENYSEYKIQHEKGRQYFEAKDFQKAAGAFEQAAKLSPNDASNFSNLGQAYYNSHQYTKAVAAFQETLRLDPNFSKAKEFLTEAETAAKEKKERNKAIWSGIAGALNEVLADDRTTQASSNGNSQQTNETQNGNGETTTSAISNAPGGFAAGHILIGRYKRDGVQQSLTFNSNGTFNRGDAAAGSIRGGEYSAGSTSSGNYYLSGHNLSLKYGDGRNETFEIEIFNCCAQPDYSKESPVQLKLNHLLYTNVD